MSNLKNAVRKNNFRQINDQSLNQILKNQDKILYEILKKITLLLKKIFTKIRLISKKFYKYCSSNIFVKIHIVSWKNILTKSTFNAVKNIVKINILYFTVSHMATYGIYNLIRLNLPHGNNGFRTLVSYTKSDARNWESIWGSSSVWLVPTITLHIFHFLVLLRYKPIIIPLVG